MKKFLFIPALALSVVTFAGSPKTETKEAGTAKSETNQQADPKWFHFNGNAENEDDLFDPSLYSAETSPQCSTAPAPYVCDVLAIPDAGNPNQPDLSTITQQRKRSTP